MWESRGHKTRFYNFDCFDDPQYVSCNMDLLLLTLASLVNLGTLVKETGDGCDFKRISTVESLVLETHTKTLDIIDHPTTAIGIVQISFWVIYI